MYQAFRRGLSRSLAGMEMRGPSQNQRRELLSSMAFYCISWLGSDRSFALTVLDLLTRPTFPWPLNLIVDQRGIAPRASEIPGFHAGVLTY
jgi:hypothetical protein